MDAIKEYMRIVDKLEHDEITLSEYEKLCEPLRNIAESEEGFTYKQEFQLSKDDMNLLQDPEFEHTDSVFYKTPSGKVVEFWKLKFGYWREKNSHTRMCSRCGFEEVMWRTDIYDYCPNCGARMKEEEE